MAEFGRFVRARRLDLGQAFSDFCAAHKVDPVAWSMMERGRIAPPPSDKLAEYARYLDLSEGTFEWYQFLDLAAKDRGIVFQPLGDEELASQLPVFLRTDADSPDHGGDDTDDLLAHLKTAIKPIA